MKSILLRNVPEDLHREVKAAAAHEGKSMQDFIIETLQTIDKVDKYLEQHKQDQGS
jgi:plasmid stability protein